MADPTTSLGFNLPPDSTKLSAFALKLREFAQKADDVLHTYAVDGNDSAFAGAINLVGSKTRAAIYALFGVAIKASVNTSGAFQIPWGTSTAAAITVPYSVGATLGDFNKGMTIAGGFVTIPKTGIYSVTAGVGSGGSAGPGHGLKVYLMKNNATVIAASETPFTDNNTWVNTSLPLPGLLLNAGDTISARALLTGGSTGTLPNSGETCFINVAMQAPA